MGTWPQPGSGISCAPGMAAAKRGAVSAPIIRSPVPKQMRTGTRMSSSPVGVRDAVVHRRVDWRPGAFAKSRMSAAASWAVRRQGRLRRPPEHDAA